MNKEDNVLQRAFDVLTENHELKTVYINNNKIYKNINGEMQEINNMNKTYIANENHQYLKVGVEVTAEGSVIDWIGLSVAKPNSQPDWYNEVKKDSHMNNLDALLQEFEELN